jgi:hypothetical protein
VHEAGCQVSGNRIARGAECKRQAEEKVSGLKPEHSNLKPTIVTVLRTILSLMD